MRKALTLLVAFAFMGSLATAQPVPAGGGSFILEENFETQAMGDWEGSCAPDSCDRADIEYVRGGAVPGDNGNGEWEHWPKTASGSAVRVDGGNLQMEMLAPPWQSYIDARNNSVALDGSNSHAVICSITMPADGSGCMFFGFSNPPGTFNKGVKLVGGSIFWAHDDDSSGDIWNASPTVNDVDTGATYTPGEQFTALFYVSTANDVEVWQHAGAQKATNGIGWVDISPAGATLTHDNVSLSLHTCGVGTVLETSLVLVDYLAWVENPNQIPVELSDFTLE